ncbi:MAG TPA: patatin-like phospholipase family protein [Candidatus Dormibacteraeota bacterium]|nr:patatin-like phospholipase family protein [Candidatus Dormibacteraeota bacterium]
MSFERLGPEHLGINHVDTPPPAVQVMLDRAQAGSRIGERNDDYSVALAIEGGGTAGIVTAGICVAMEEMGLIKAVDKIYGSSAGALNGVYTAAGQAVVGTTNYEDLMFHPAFFSRKRLFLPGPSAADVDYLIYDRVAKQNPINLKALPKGPEFAAIAVNLNTMATEVLEDFSDHIDRLQALRASCSMPVLSGRKPYTYRGMPLTDGAMLSSVPVPEALAGGATHVLALRSRGANYSKVPYSKNEVRFTRYYAQMGAELVSLMEGRPATYNKAAEELQRGELENVTQLAPDAEEPVAQFEESLTRAHYGFKLGALAAAKVFGAPEQLAVYWDPIPENPPAISVVTK